MSDALAGAVESYSYDAAGNVVEMTEMNGTTWFYELHTGMNQVPGRTNGSTDEVYEYDDSGRVVSVTSDSKDEVGYQYDGLGRLRALTDASGAVTRSFDRDAAGDIVRRGQADNALVMSYSYAFKQWNYNEYSGEVEENLTSMISLVNGDRRWHFKDFDGQAVATVDDDGTMVGRRRLSAYGQVQSEQGDPSVVASFHGIREEKGLDLLAAGPRHLARTDGRWLQPEPLLHMGIPQESLSDPLSLSTYRYSRNTPTVYQDRSGYSPVETLDEYLAETYLMPADGRISSAYNPNRFHPIEKKPKPHNGTDIDAPTGTPVRAPMDGSIQRVVPLNKDAGNTIQMLDTKGVEWKFFHLDSFNVEVGDVVKRGDVIGAVGNTGASTGPHLHAETRVDGEHFDKITHNPKNDPLQLLTPEEQEEMDAIIREAGDLEPKQDGEIPSYSEE